MTLQERTLFKTMTAQQQAIFLLSKGVTARDDFGSSSDEPVFYAYADDVVIAQAGAHGTEKTAIEEGIKWLQQRISTD